VKRVLLDADAFLCLRSLDLLRRICASALRDEPLIMTEYIARKELSSVATLVQSMVDSGCLKIVLVSASKHTETGRLWKELRTERIDKGESEALAWVLPMKAATRPVFVSREVAARRVAKERHVPSTDVFGFVVALVEAGWLTRPEAETALQIWDDKRQELCKPSDWLSFDVNYAKRLVGEVATFSGA
jgi:predicted nucleic acid-binding protein